MRAAVELLPVGGVDEPVVGTEVDDDRAVAAGLELGGDRAAGAVRQGEDDDVVAGELVDARRGEHPVGERAQVRLVRTEQRARRWSAR